MAESIAINGTSLLTYMKSIQSVQGLVGPPALRGGDFETPHRDGSLTGSRWAAPRIATVMGTLYGDANGRAGYLDNIRGLTKLVYNDAKDFTVTRVIPRVSGGDLTVVAAGRYGGGLESIEQAAHHAGRCAFDLVLFDAFWHPSSDTILSTMTAPGGGGSTSTTPSIAGDVATRRVTVTVSGTNSGTTRLTNNTTGHWIDIPVTAGASTVIDCEAFTATRSGVSVAGTIAHNPAFDDWMLLAAGTNSLTVNGAANSVDIAYRGAYA